MASDEIKQILVKWNIDASSWKSALSDLVKLQADANAKDKAAAADRKKQLDDALAVQKLQLAEQKTQTAEFNTQKAAAQALQQQQIAIKAAITAQVEQEKLVTAQINAQTAALKLQAQQQKLNATTAGAAAGGRGAGGGGAAGGGALGALGAGFSRVFGGGGGLAQGVFQGAALVLILEKVGEALAGVLKQFYELGQDIGPIQQMTDQFERLSAGKGIDPAKFLGDLGSASLGLVGRMDLLRLANDALRSNLGLTEQQVVKLTQSTVNLALANGKTAPEAIKALTQALLTGRTQGLARVTGLRRDELQKKGLGSALDDTQKSKETFAKLADTMAEKSADAGPAIDTITMKIARLSTSIKNFFTDALLTMANSDGFNTFQEMFGNVVDSISQFLKDSGPSIGDFLGEAFNALASFFSTMRDGLKYLFQMGSAIIDAGKYMVNLVEKSDDLEGSLSTGLTTLQKFNVAVQLIKGTFDLIGLSIKNMGAAFLIMTDGLTQKGGLSALEELYANNKKEAQDLADEQAKKILEAANSTPSTKKNRPPIVNTHTADDNAKNRKALDAAKTAERKAAIAAELADTKELLESKRSLYKADYDAGKLALVDYLNFQKDIDQKIFEASVIAAVATARAQKSEIDNQVHEKQFTSAVGAVKKKVVDENLRRQVDKLEETKNKQIAGLDLQGDQDILAARKVQMQAELFIQQESIKQQEDAAKEAYDQFLLSEQDYETKRLQLIEDGYQLYVQERSAQYLEEKDTEANRAKYLSDIDKKRAEADQQANKIRLGAPDEQVAQQQKIFQAQLALIEAQRTAGQNSFTLGPNALSEDAAIAQMVQAYKDMNAQLQIQVDLLDELGQQGSANWYKLTTEILKNDAAIKGVQSSATSYFTLFQSAASGIFGSLGGSASQQLGQSAAWAKTAQQQGVSSSPIGAIIQSIQGMANGTVDAKKGLKVFTDALGDTVNSIQAFAAAIHGTGGPVQAGLTGAASGSSLLGSAFGAVDSLTGLFGSVAGGPLGSLVGGAIGGVIGIFSGKAKATTEKLTKQLTDSFNAVATSFSQGATTLESALTQEQALRQQAINQLSGQKGGRDQLNQILPQFDQAISQLQAKQAQIFKSMNDTLQTLEAPSVYDEQISKVQTIIQKYQEYVDAGGDVVKANEYLTLSYKRLSEDGLSTLTQDQETAIQDAINLQDLIKQSADLAQQAADQIYSIETQGSLVRSQSLAQTRLQQIQKIQQDRDARLADLNNQIQLAQYKVSAEQQVFNLATDRIALEAQLLQLQQAGINQDMQRIAALQNLLKTIQTGGTSVNSIQALLQGLGLVPTPSGTGAVAGGADLTTLLAGLYGDRGSQGIGTFYGETP